ncbi:MAG: hypothetical protein LJE74_10240 [Proteobacteria bacterium]|jgi:hypothetical protein|nr:hypothetical protein [Pseudomonadota bacterium]
MQKLPLNLVVPFILFATSSRLVFAVTLSTGIDEVANLPYWEIKGDGMTLRLVQRLPDQSRGFAMARGFTPEQAEVFAQSCAFQTVFKNISNLTTPGTLNYNLRDWIIYYQGKKRGMKTREDWEKTWPPGQVKPAAQLALNWGLYPTVQSYKPGDYNWGLSTFNLKPGAMFDLRVVWHQYDKQHEFVIHDVQCAPDIHPDPDDIN